MTKATPATTLRWEIADHVWCELFVVVLLALSWMQVLAGNFGILDDPWLCTNALAAKFLQPSTWLNIDRFSNTARPGEFIVVLPAFISWNPMLQYIYQNIVTLGFTMLGCYLLVRGITRRRWLAGLAALAIVTTPSFSCNYHVLSLCEPFMLASMVGVLCVLRALLEAAPRRTMTRIVLVATGVVCGLLATNVKEPAGVFVIVYVSALFLLSWGYKRRLMETLRRTWWLSVAVAVGFLGLIAALSTLKGVYAAGGKSAYALGSAALRAGAGRIAVHLLQTASYAVLALLLALLAAAPVWRVTAGSPPEARRVQTSWCLVLLLWCLAAAGVYAPWGVFDARYLLVAATAAVLFSACAVGLGLTLFRQAQARMLKLILAAMVAVTLLLLVAHAVYGSMTGPFSEGRVRQRFDQSYNRMFAYVAAHAPTNGTVYLLMNPAVPEAMQNSVIALDEFYGRPDLHCVFPTATNEFFEPGYIAVSHVEFTFNYTRMPTHAGRSSWFYKDCPTILRTAAFRSQFVATTEVFYTRDDYNVPQYQSAWGLPAFWDLKRGRYIFGWTLWWYPGSPAALRSDNMWMAQGPDVLVNGAFGALLTGWDFLGQAHQFPMSIRLFPFVSHAGTTTVLRIENQAGKHVGLRQQVTLQADHVYRLVAKGRNAEWLRGSREQGPSVILARSGADDVCLRFDQRWHSQWSWQQTVFTARAARTAIVSIQLGNGFAHGVGEISNVRLEDLSAAPARPTAPVSTPSVELTPASAPAAAATMPVRSLLANGLFTNGLASWTYWKDGLSNSNAIDVRAPEHAAPLRPILRIENPNRRMLGVQQLVRVASGGIYRLQAVARSTATTDSQVLFGGRVALFLPSAMEYELVWMSESTNWWRKTLEFTNAVDGVATLYVHMGYGKVASTGEFADVRLEALHEDAVIATRLDSAAAATTLGTRLPTSTTAPASTPSAAAPARELLTNGRFTQGLRAWNLWRDAKDHTNAVRAVAAAATGLGIPALRLENPQARLIGVQQLVRLASGGVYRLQGLARSTATTDNQVLFGGRIALYLPDAAEHELVWMSESTNWWRKTLEFTNAVDGVATVYVHMGYGGVASTGEFADVRLEHVAGDR
jgi:hypothetical protein